MQPAKLETLNDLLTQAEHYANHSLRNFDQMPPALFLTGPDGPAMFIAKSLADGPAKDDFATTARLMCVANAATSVVMAFEVWARFALPGEVPDEKDPPSEAIDRREIVMLLGESRTGKTQKFLPIIRSDNGNFFSLSDAEAPKTGAMEGRFVELLPEVVPDAASRALARSLLAAKGFMRVAAGREGIRVRNLDRCSGNEPTPRGANWTFSGNEMAYAGGDEMEATPSPSPNPSGMSRFP